MVQFWFSVPENGTGTENTCREKKAGRRLRLTASAKRREKKQQQVCFAKKSEGDPSSRRQEVADS